MIVDGSFFKDWLLKTTRWLHLTPILKRQNKNDRTKICQQKKNATHSINFIDFGDFSMGTKFKKFCFCVYFFIIFLIVDVFPQSAIVLTFLKNLLKNVRLQNRYESFYISERVEKTSVEKQHVSIDRNQNTDYNLKTLGAFSLTLARFSHSTVQ